MSCSQRMQILVSVSLIHGVLEGCVSVIVSYLDVLWSSLVRHVRKQQEWAAPWRKRSWESSMVTRLAKAMASPARAQSHHTGWESRPPGKSLIRHQAWGREISPQVRASIWCVARHKHSCNTTAVCPGWRPCSFPSSSGKPLQTLLPDFAQRAPRPAKASQIALSDQKPGLDCRGPNSWDECGIMHPGSDTAIPEAREALPAVCIAPYVAVVSAGNALQPGLLTWLPCLTLSSLTWPFICSLEKLSSKFQVRLFEITRRF